MSDQPIEVEATTTESQAVAVVSKDQAVVNPLDLEPAMFKAGLDRRKENRRHLIDWVREALVEGTDFGRVHFVNKSKCSAGNACTNPGHFSKPVLFKPGAEKICGMLGVTPTFPTLQQYEDAAIAGTPVKSIILRCEIVNSGGHVVASGVGGRSVEQDYGDLNKSLKMAEKSGHIDATLRMAGLSEIFTQDLEDMAQREMAEPAGNAPGRVAQTPPPSDATPVNKTPPAGSQRPYLTQEPPQKELKHATEETRKWFVERTRECREQATQFCIDLTWLMPNQGLEDLPLRFVPNTKPKLVEFMAKMLAWAASGNVTPPYEADWEAEGPQKQEKSGSSAKDQPWYKVVVPIPRKGMKRDAYLKNPDTIGSLYDARHDDEDARKRLWGMCKNGEENDWTPKAREYNGKTYAPSKEDKEFFTALRVFKMWFDENHEDKL